MDLSCKQAVLEFQTIAIINEAHNIYLVQHQPTNKIYIKKILDVYNINIYKHLFNNHIIGTPRIINYYEENNQLIIIEEYISGSNLQEKIQNSELTQNDILSYMIDLCEILEKLHAVKPAIIHRDIKPSNIIISSYNKAILLDFNAAKYYSTVTEDTILLGTHGYAAPEQYGFGASSPQTDIYSLGILLKEMLISANQLNTYYESIINKCTQLNPVERFNNIIELKKELSQHNVPVSHKLLPKAVIKYVPPGFRTHTPWKMLISFIYYLFTLWLCLTIEIKDTFGFALWVERLFLLSMILFIPFGSFNYLGVQKLIPLCRHKYRIVRYLGIAILDVTVIFTLFLILFIIESLISI